MTVDPIIQWALQTLASSVIAFVTFLVVGPTKIGERYLDFFFDRRLAAFKGAQDEKIEQLKESLSHRTDRGKRSNEREFSAITAAWEAFVDAYLTTNQCVISYISHPDLDRLDEEELKVFLNGTDFSETQKTWVTKATYKNQIYSRIVRNRSINSAGQTVYDARLVIKKQGIFIAKPLRDLFEQKLDIFSMAQAEQSMNAEFPGDRMRDNTAIFMEHGGQALEELSSAVRDRMLRVE